MRRLRAGDLAHGSALYLTLGLILSIAGCRGDPVDIDIELPAAMQALARKDPHPLIAFLHASVPPDPTRLFVYRMFVHPSLGQTFFVNIDSDRRIVKLHPVKERGETIVLYDPEGIATVSFETGSSYVQSRCPECRSNRFEIGAAFVFPPADPEHFDRFWLGGRCAECGHETILYES